VLLLFALLPLLSVLLAPLLAAAAVLQSCWEALTAPAMLGKGCSSLLAAAAAAAATAAA
jgi:hypothetical protein